MFVNRTRTVADLDLHRVVRAIKRQIAEDFERGAKLPGELTSMRNASRFSTLSVRVLGVPGEVGQHVDGLQKYCCWR
jgi:hypothetical protein